MLRGQAVGLGRLEFRAVRKQCRRNRKDWVGGLSRDCDASLIRTAWKGLRDIHHGRVGGVVEYVYWP